MALEDRVERLEDDMRDYKKRTRRLEEFRATVLWQRALEEADLQTTPPTTPEVNA